MLYALKYKNYRKNQVQDLKNAMQLFKGLDRNSGRKYFVLSHIRRTYPESFRVIDRKLSEKIAFEERFLGHAFENRALNKITLQS